MARFVARVDRKGVFAFLPMRSAEAEPFVALVPDADRFKSFHIVDPVRGGLSKGPAVMELGRRLAPRPLRRIFDWPRLTILAGAL